MQPRLAVVVVLAAAVARTATAQPGNCLSFAQCEPRARPDVPEPELQAATALMRKWDRAVTVDNDAQAVVELFCAESELWGTVSDNLRTSIPEIKSYFDYFAVKDNTIVADCSFVTRSADGALANARQVQWSLGGSIVCARMEFQLSTRAGNGTCIKSLHSSAFPVVPSELRAIDQANNVTWPPTAPTPATAAPTAAAPEDGSSARTLAITTGVLAATTALLLVLLVIVVARRRQPALEAKSAREAPNSAV